MHSTRSLFIVRLRALEAVLSCKHIVFGYRNLGRRCDEWPMLLKRNIAKSRAEVVGIGPRFEEGLNIIGTKK